MNVQQVLVGAGTAAATFGVMAAIDTLAHSRYSASDKVKMEPGESLQDAKDRLRGLRNQGLALQGVELLAYGTAFTMGMKKFASNPAVGAGLLAGSIAGTVLLVGRGMDYVGKIRDEGGYHDYTP